LRSGGGSQADRSASDHKACLVSSACPLFSGRIGSLAGWVKGDGGIAAFGFLAGAFGFRGLAFFRFSRFGRSGFGFLFATGPLPTSAFRFGPFEARILLFRLV